MATTILTVAGQVLGGPWGAALGNLAGRALEDRGGAYVRRPVTLSGYGVPVPRVFGRMRVGGVVVWAGPVTAAEEGKGGAAEGAVASFAVVVAQAPVLRIGRIWVNGVLLRDADGRFTRRVAMREHLGGDGLPDPLVAAAMPGGAPAFAGLAYVVFEDFDLEAFGGGGDMSFEVVGSEGNAGDWVAALAGAVAAPGEALGAGLAVEGRAADLEAAAALAGVGLAAAPEGVALTGRRRVVLRRDDIIAEGEPGAVAVRSAAAPAAVRVLYADADHDHLGAAQQTAGGPAVDVTMPGSASAADALRFARREQARMAAGAWRWRVRLPWRHLGLRVGDNVRFDDDRDVFVVRERVVVGLTVEATLERISAADWQDGAAEAGQAAARAEVVSPTSLLLFRAGPAGWHLAVGGGRTWAGASLMLIEASGRVRALPFRRTRAVMGRLVDAVAAEGSESMVIELESAEDQLFGATVAAFLSGQNWMAVDDELVGFESAAREAGGRWLLSGVHRGLGGTSPMAHGVGARVAMVPEAGLAAWRLPEGIGDGPVTVTAIGPGDPAAGQIVTAT